MSSVEAAVSSLRRLISSDNFDLPYEHLKLDTTNKKWTSDQEALVATYCLVVVNMKAHEAFKSNIQNTEYIQKMFKLTELCCDLVEKTWKCNGANFLGSIYTICRYFLSQNNVYETLVISQYAMEYVETRKTDTLNEDELRSIKALLLLQLKYLSCSELTASNSETLFNMWKFVFSHQATDVKNSCASAILEVFQNFCGRVVSLVDYSEMSVVLILYLKEIQFTNLTDSNLCSFIAICRILINSSTSDETKKITSTIIDCIDDFSASKTTSQNQFCKFCCNILRFSICKIDSTNLNLVAKCVEQLHSTSFLPQPLISHAVYFASVILMHSRHCWIDEEAFFYKHCIAEVMKLLLALANQIKSINMNQISGTKNKSAKDHLYPVYLANLVLSLAYRIPDLDAMQLETLYPYVNEATRISLKVYNNDCEIDAKRKFQLYYLIGASCVNVSRIYIKAELYTKSQQISMMAAQKIAILSSSQLSDSSLQPCIKKLVTCLFDSFKNLNLYKDALRTTCIWAYKLPCFEKFFMELFASLKAKIFSSENKDHLNTTSWHLLVEDKQKSQLIWNNIDLKNLQIIPLLKSELRQYAAYSVSCASLIKKIIDIVNEKDDIFLKIEFYTLSGIILTMSSDCLKNATELLPPIETFIKQLENENKSKITKEKSIVYSYLLGNLYYAKFRINLLSARSESEQEVMWIDKIKRPSSVLELGMEQEPRDVTDIINKHLMYESQQNITSVLDSAISHWSIALKKMKNVKSVEKYFDVVNDGSSLITFIREAAFLYRLYCHESKEADAWKLLHCLAIICDDSDVALFAFSNLTSIHGSCDLKWQTEAETKLTSASESTRIRYWLETASKLLKCGNASEGTAVLSKISESDVKNHGILYAKYCFTISQYEYAGYIAPMYNPAITAFKAYCRVVSWIKSGSWRTFWESCEAQSLLFDVTLFIGNFYRGSYLINDAKCYLQEHVNMIQKLCLPLRISQFLIALCQVSFITCNVEDYYTKLSALKSVLKLGNENRKKNYMDESCYKTSVAVPPILDMDSDVRFASNYPSNDLFSSPVLESGLKFDIPEFAYHKINCSCGLCGDTRYQQISCEVMCLFASYFYRAGKPGKALHHFKSVLEMVDIIQNRLKPEDTEKKMEFTKLKIITKFREADFWASCRDFEKAEILNEEATADSLRLIVPDHAILKELKDQYWALKAIKTDTLVKEESPPKKKPSRLKAPLPITVTKTPAGKASVAIFEDDDEDSKAAALIQKMTITPYPKHSRRLLFKKDEPSFVTPVKPATSSRNTRFNNKQDDTPPDIVMQTPSSVRRTTRSVKKNVEGIASVVPNTRLRSRRK